MTTISAKMIEDSVSPAGKRLSTLLLTYPRWIHAELMTHRVFSRNAASSRAIPIDRMIQAVRDDPAEPIYWGKNQRGMQAAEELTGDALENAKVFWKAGLMQAVETARELAKRGLHKQIVNRILEPYMHIRTLVSATEWANFFALRDHPDAEPHLRMLAQAIRAEMNASTPTRLEPRLNPGQWHLPYVLPAERQSLTGEECLLLSGARCASLSYQTVDGQQMTLERAKELKTKLMGAPMHASPFEHQGTPDICIGRWKADGRPIWNQPEQHGNFIGWRQYRKMLPGEAVW